MKITMPGYRLHEYKLVVPLPETIGEKVTELRNTLFEKYKVKSNQDLKPCLTLLSCFSYEKSEERLIAYLQQIAMGTDVFKVDVASFSAYPSHSIYINVATKEPFHHIAKELKRGKRLLQVPAHEPLFFNEPQLMLAQNLKPFQFISMWLDCEHSAFSGKFMADAFLLLKRNSNHRYEIVRRMEFMNLPLQVAQGSLFA